jgi:hypothetical protein
MLEKVRECCLVSDGGLCARVARHQQEFDVKASIRAAATLHQRVLYVACVSGKRARPFLVRELKSEERETV